MQYDFNGFVSGKKKLLKNRNIFLDLWDENKKKWKWYF